MQNNKPNYFKVHNFLDKTCEENEDDISVKKMSNKILMVALSDGAGGAGIYCKDWANKIVENQPDEHSIDWKSWFIDLGKSFYEEIEKKLPDDVFIQERFKNSGSFATLLYLWINDNIVYFTGFGDTTLFIFSKNNKLFIPKIIYPINRQESLQSNPYLINWNSEIPKVIIEKFECNSGDTIICATDSISRWIIQHLFTVIDSNDIYSLLPNFYINRNLLEKTKCNTEIKTINDMVVKLTSIKTDKEFKHFLESEIKSELLEPDDFTLFTYII